MSSDAVHEIIDAARDPNTRLLNLSRHDLPTLPSEIWSLTHLTSLHLSSNHLQSLPSDIGRLTGLWKLHIIFNDLRFLPPEIGLLENLEHLELMGNQLSLLPAEIGQLHRLKCLHLNNNQLSSLPPQIGDLSDLERLYVRRNQLRSLPSEIGKLQKLRLLYVDENQLTSLPSSITQLTQLSELHIQSNQLDSFPGDFNLLPRLTELRLDLPLAKAHRALLAASRTLKRVITRDEWPAWVIQQMLDASRFKCCGNEDLHPFRCIHCAHPMVLCCECDSVYHRLPDASATTVPDWKGWNCPQCDAILNGIDFTTPQSHISFGDWSRHGLDDFLSPRPINELFAMVMRSSGTLLEHLQRNRQTSAKQCAHDIARIADAIAHCYPGVRGARQSAFAAAQSSSLRTALAETTAIADPIQRAYAILGVCDTLTFKRDRG